MIVDAEDPRYQAQIARMMRWREKFRDINDDFQERLDDYLDIAYAFFLNCYHLKDWLINDPGCTIPADQIERYITENECLSLCADICNASKHLRLDRSRSDKKPKIGSDDFFDTVLPGERSRRTWWYIQTESKMYDPIELANECVECWELFFENHDLI